MKTEREITELIRQMTLEEKASLCSGADAWRTKKIERLGIPALRVSDGPTGLRMPEDLPDGKYGKSVPATCFPTACALASSWNRETARKVGAAIAREAKGEGVGILLGPGVNMKRSPLCGRNFEYYSEDPCLAGELAAAYVDGVQEEGVGACLKHFAVNNQETRRHTVSANVDERTLREIYLPAFETVVKKARPATVMESYNSFNGTPVSRCGRLLTDILRGEWGFDGTVMSDWAAVHDRPEDLAAGLDLEMPGTNGYRDEEIVEAVREGKIREETLDLAVSRVLKTVFTYAEQSAPKADPEESRRIAQEAEEDAIILLKNEQNVLPFAPGAPLALIGALAEKPRIQGGGSSHINVRRVSSFRETVAAANGEKTEYVAGYTLDGAGDADALIEEAVAAARRCGRALIVAGLPEQIESEGYDRASMKLPENQNRLIAAVAAATRRVAVLLVAGSPVELPWAGRIPAILHAYLGGECVAEASARVVFGAVNPSGHLAETMPLALEDTPSYLNFPGDRDECFYAEGIYIGYRWYEKMKKPVLFPFGHGLSYTSFELSDPAADGKEVSVTVKNTGARAGKAVVQVYVGQENAPLPRPEKELRAFRKVALAPGEEKRLSFPLTDRDLSFYDVRTAAFRALTGTYRVFFGFSSADTRCAVSLSHTETPPKPAPITRNTSLLDLVTDPVYAPAVRDLLCAIYSPGFDKELDERGISFETQPRLRAFRFSALRMFVNHRQGGLTEKALNEAIKRANETLGL
ncbi:MAG: glycoside hydrolase family 3 C-terminal domain-containing protein [Clostridia bacterium]|nr:glycoside hydrolase family 3 C-terminal domain-containing protein [Clostridia bacterium]